MIIKSIVSVPAHKKARGYMGEFITSLSEFDVPK